MKGHTVTELETLAKTIYGEARGEKQDGMDAVANVIINRVKIALEHGGKYWWGKDIKSVCLNPYQFSCWNDNDPNACVLHRNLSGEAVYQVCERIASRAIKGVLADNTNGATHYHTKAIHPKWATAAVPCAEIGNHLFYKGV